MQQAFGRMPDYKYQESEDFGIKSESMLEVQVTQEQLQ